MYPLTFVFRPLSWYLGRRCHRRHPTTPSTVPFSSFQLLGKWSLWSLSLSRTLIHTHAQIHTFTQLVSNMVDLAYEQASRTMPTTTAARSRVGAFLLYRGGGLDLRSVHTEMIQRHRAHAFLYILLHNVQLGIRYVSSLPWLYSSTFEKKIRWEYRILRSCLRERDYNCDRRVVWPSLLFWMNKGWVKSDKK